MRLRAAIPVAEILRHLRPFFLAESEPSRQLLDSKLFIESFLPPELSESDSLTFLGADSSLKLRSELKATLIISEVLLETRSPTLMVQVASIHPVMASLISLYKNQFEPNYEISIGKAWNGSNQIATGAVIEGHLAGNVYVGSGSFIGKGSFVGSGTRIEPNVTIQENCIIGKNCVIQSGAVIGSAGFGFYPGEKGMIVMPHWAGVLMGDDCWIGANVVIAAGVLSPTQIGNHCKLDSHVQIAHNVRMGDECLLASQSGVAGSTVIGNRFQMGGAASIDGHLQIGDDVSVAACSGVTKDLDDKSVVAGFPAQPLGEWRRQQIHLRHLDSRKK